MPNRFTVAALFGVATFIITAWLGIVGPKQVAHPVAGDNRDPVIAMEMVRTPEQLTAVIGESRQQYSELRDAIDKVNRIDFIFMTAYGAFLASFFLAVAQARNDRRWVLFSLLAVVAVMADARENMTLLQLTQDGADVPPLIGSLMVSTWIKWMALGLSAAGAGYAIYADQRMPYLRMFGGIVGVAAFASTLGAYFDPLRLAQMMAIGIFLTWLIQAIYAYRLSRP